MTRASAVLAGLGLLAALVLAAGARTAAGQVLSGSAGMPAAGYGVPVAAAEAVAPNLRRSLPKAIPARAIEARSGSQSAAVHRAPDRPMRKLAATEGNVYLPVALRDALPAPLPTGVPTREPTATVTLEPTLAPTADTTPSPTTGPTARPTEHPGAPTFELEVIPVAITNSVPGQRCVFLLAVRSLGNGPDLTPIALGAVAPGAEVVVEPALVVPDKVAEITVIPAMNQQEQTVPIRVRAVRGEEVREVVASLDVLTDMPGIDADRGAYAATVRDRFIPWLAAHHPELGITANTAWQGTIVTPQWLVVMHYLFFSPEWEMHVEWHVMIPPYDWARIDLRHRFDETKPSQAFEISSWSANTEPIPIEAPEKIWR